MDYLIKNNIFSKDAINEELIYDNSMIECAQNIIKSDNFLDVWSDCTYFHSFLVAVELYMSDDGYEQLYKLINEKIENMEDSLQVTSKYVDVNRNIGEYQKKMIKLKEKITS